MLIDRNNPPALGPVQKLHALEPTLHYLLNRIPVYILETGEQDIIRVDIIFQAGSRYQQKIFQAASANTLLSEGTITKSARQIADELDFYGSYLIPGFDRDESHIQAYSLNKFLPATLDIVADIIKNPIFPDNELKIFRQKFRARKTFIRTLFGEQHPYGLIGEPKDIEKIRRDDIVDFHASYYHPAQCSIILSGRPAIIFPFSKKDLEIGQDQWKNLEPCFQPDLNKHLQAMTYGKKYRALYRRRFVLEELCQ